MYHDCQKTDAKDSNNMDTFDGSIFEDSLDNYVVNIFRSIYTDFYDYYSTCCQYHYSNNKCFSQVPRKYIDPIDAKVLHGNADSLINDHR